mgnify:CR=1 FL=1|tara:strand:+ start:5571 stop:5774 length:204 start_codon:yes stop_codon:yes gene_type:complete
MARIHGRVRRKLQMFRSRKKSSKKKPKTFKSEEAAKKYAEAKDFKNYKLVNLQPFNPKKTKIKIVVE